MKKFLRMLADGEPIVWLGICILLIWLISLLASCGAIPGVTTARVMDNTTREIDSDGSGSISMIELISYLIGYDVLKGGGIAGFQRFRNGRRNGKASAEDCGP